MEKLAATIHRDYVPSIPCPNGDSDGGDCCFNVILSVWLSSRQEEFSQTFFIFHCLCLLGIRLLWKINQRKWKCFRCNKLQLQRLQKRLFLACEYSRLSFALQGGTKREDRRLRFPARNRPGRTGQIFVYFAKKSVTSCLRRVRSVNLKSTKFCQYNTIQYNTIIYLHFLLK